MEEITGCQTSRSDKKQNKTDWEGSLWMREAVPNAVYL